MSEPLTSVLLFGIIGFGMFGVFHSKKKTHPSEFQKRKLEDHCRGCDCEVVLPGGVHFCYARGALQSNGWKTPCTERSAHVPTPETEDPPVVVPGPWPEVAGARRKGPVPRRIYVIRPRNSSEPRGA